MPYWMAEKRVASVATSAVAHGLAANPGSRVGNRKRACRGAKRWKLEQEAPASAARRPLQGNVAPLPLLLEVDRRERHRGARRGGRRAGRIAGCGPLPNDQRRIPIDLRARGRARRERRVSRSRRGRNVRRPGRARDRERGRREQKGRELSSLGAIHAPRGPALRPRDGRLSQGNAALPSTRNRPRSSRHAGEPESRRARASRAPIRRRPLRHVRQRVVREGPDNPGDQGRAARVRRRRSAIRRAVRGARPRREPPPNDSSRAPIAAPPRTCATSTSGWGGP